MQSLRWTELFASGETVVYAHAQAEAVSCILTELSKVPGVNITSAATDSTTLEEVGVDAGRAREVRDLLERTIGVHLTEEIVPSLTIAQYVIVIEVEALNIIDSNDEFLCMIPVLRATGRQLVEVSCRVAHAHRHALSAPERGDLAAGRPRTRRAYEGPLSLCWEVLQRTYAIPSIIAGKDSLLNNYKKLSSSICLNLSQALLPTILKTNLNQPHLV
ncbi:hypothetical protein ACJJTC_006053 [Scirpophaga incertulas]